MQETNKPPPTGIWLALSGGGMRAALFHYGAIKRLYELGLLQDVTAISATIFAHRKKLKSLWETSPYKNWKIFGIPVLTIGGVSAGRERLVETIELPQHPWFFACQFHPEFTSTPRKGHPLFTAYIKAALANKKA